MAKWPNVPAVYGWLRLDARGHWWLRGGRVDNPEWVDYIQRNYAPDARGAWYFQNGPQKVYADLEVAPWVLRAGADGVLRDQGGGAVGAVRRVLVDEAGRLVFDTSRGAALLDSADLDWVLERLDGADDLEAAVSELFMAASGTTSGLRLRLDHGAVPVARLDGDALPAALGFVRHPAPQA